MTIKCLIVDDELPAVDELGYILSQIPDIDIVGSANSAGSAINSIRSKQPDLVFLDIKMPGRDGFEVVQACVRLSKMPLFVFATAYDEHAVKAFDANAVDYILKPFQMERVLESVDRARHLLAARKQDDLYGQMEKLMASIQAPMDPVTKISVEHRGRILLLSPEHILYFKAENKGVLACTQKEQYDLHGTASLTNLESKLKTYGFFRSHRGYLVNISYVKELVPWFNGKYILTMADQSDTEVPVSRNRVKSLKSLLGL